MLLAFTGLRNLGIITFDSATLITLGGCPANQRNYLYAFDHRLTTEDLATASMQSLPIPATVYGCIGEDVSWVLGNLCALVCSVHDSTAVHSCAARWHVQASWLAAADVPHNPPLGWFLLADAVTHHVAGHCWRLPHVHPPVHGRQGLPHHRNCVSPGACWPAA
jgi:hypothetical protein